MSTDLFGNLPNFREIINSIIILPNLPPALIVATLNFFPDFISPFKTKRALKIIATSLKSEEHFPEEYGGNRHVDSYRKALIRCAIRMANLGMTKEVNQTLLVTAPQRYRMWLLREAWHTDQLVSFALSMAARCAIESRVADLFDCLPQELWELVEDAARPLTDEAQRTLLNERLKDLEKTPNVPSPKGEGEGEGQRKKNTLSQSELSHVPDRVSQGVIPLLVLVRQLTTMIEAATMSQAKAATLGFFKAWESFQSSDHQSGLYITRDNLHFVNAIFKGSASEIFLSLNSFILNATEELNSCLNKCQILAPETVIHFTRLLAAHKSCQTQAGKLAVLAVQLIEREEDVKHRSQLFASLSRALLRASLFEASLIFQRGLNELDAIGSGDNEFVSELLHFAATIESGKLPPELALRLAKICELNVYDSDKWSWPLTAAAFARVSGTPYLAQIARWHDRNKADLSLTLPSALTYLLKDGALNPALAVSLLWLVDPQPLWGWGWNDLVKVLAEQNANDSILHDILDQYEHSFPGRSSDRYTSEIRKSFESFPVFAAKFAERLTFLEQRASQPRHLENVYCSKTSILKNSKDHKNKDAALQAKLNNILAKTNPIDDISFEAFVDELNALPRWNLDKTSIYKRLRNDIAYADRAKHIEVIVSAKNLRLFEKNDLLQAIKNQWTEDSPTQLACLSTFGQQLVKEHADELLGKSWGVTTDILKLSKVTDISTEELAISLIEAATTRQLDASATNWLSIATIVAKRAETTTPLKALERLLDSGTARLADEIGDGPWNEDLDPGTDSDKIAAGLLWFCLGSPTANQRWRAAHAVRSVAKNGQWNVIKRMFELLNKDDAGAFQDRSLPFFKYNAQFWFLLAIARIALDFPEEIFLFRVKLEAIAFQNSFPHVGIREAACEALRCCIERKHNADLNNLNLRISKVNVSKFPLTKTSSKDMRYIYEKRPENIPRPDPCFHFDYDFEKYNVTELARIFGLPKWRIKDFCRDWIREWAPDAISMDDFSGRQRPYRRRGYYLPTEKAHQSYGAYLAWHALAVVSGQLLLERPVIDVNYYDDPWEKWLTEYRITRKDGYWISDGTGNYPLVALHDLRSGDDPKTERERPVDDKSFLAMLAGIGDPLQEEITVQAWWDSPDGVECCIMSALVDPVNVELTAQAVATSPPFQMWLPHQEFDGDDDSYVRLHGMEPCEPWIVNIEQAENLDDRDPFGSSSALSIYQPARSLISMFQLAPTKPWSHTWIERNGSIAFSYNGWGGWQGDGEGENRHTGHALYCNRAFLTKLLTKMNRNLIILVKLQKYNEPKKYSSDEESDSHFTHSFLVVVLDKSLNARIIEPTSEQLKAISKLNKHDIYDFAKRLQAISGLKQ